MVPFVLAYCCLLLLVVPFVTSLLLFATACGAVCTSLLLLATATATATAAAACGAVWY